MSVSLEKIKSTASQLGAEACAIYAVQQVESGSLGAFYSSGFPVILFEGHIMYRELNKIGKDPNSYLSTHPSVVHKNSTTQYYGGGETNQRKRLDLAISIDEGCALRSASWGLFQVMGFNYFVGAWGTVQDFVKDMKKSSDNHFEAFISFCKYNNLVRYIVSRNWASFAKGYNGSNYAQYQYDIKMKNNYNSCINSNKFNTNIPPVVAPPQIVIPPVEIPSTEYPTGIVRPPVLEQWMNLFIKNLHDDMVDINSIYNKAISGMKK